MKFRAIIFAPVVALMLATPVAAETCSESVANNPILHETVAHYCPIPVLFPDPALTQHEDASADAKPVLSKPPKKVVKTKRKQRCWYTNKRGQRKYRMRYSCS